MVTIEEPAGSRAGRFRRLKGKALLRGTAAVACLLSWRSY
jgi:hypothetical protein